MPTNLPPDYFHAEERYRQAETPGEKIACLEEMISKVPRHKGTEHLMGELRRQLSRLKTEAQSHKKHGNRQLAYHVDREGAGQAILLGPANVGKSALVAALTRAEPEVSPAPYTTRVPAPGMMPVENVLVQLIDTPALERDFTEPALFDLARRSDLALLVIDLQGDPLGQLEDSLALLEEHRIAPLARKEQLANRERMVFLPFLILVNKCDSDRQDEDFRALCDLFEGECPLIAISAESKRNFAQLKQKVWERLEAIRVYAQPPGKEPDLERPFVLKKGSTVIDMARKIHRDFYENLKSARVWGSAAIPGQMVSRDYVLQDGDIVELRI